MARRFAAAILIGIFTCIGATGTSWGQLKTVKVACTSKVVLDNLPLFVGDSMGFFKEEGLNAELSYFRGGGDVVRAITTGSVDLGATPAASAVLIAAAKGEPIKIISGSAAPIFGVVWVVDEKSPLKSIKDLKGKKAGYSSPGSLTFTVLTSVLKSEGLEKDVQLVRVGNPGDGWAALKNGIVDSSWHVVPAVYDLIRKREARVLFDTSQYIQDYQQTVVVAMEDVIKKDPEMLRKFLRARAKAVRFIRTNADKTAEIWAKALELPVETTRLALKNMNLDYYEIGAPKKKNLEGALDEVMTTGAIKTAPDVTKFMDLRFLPQ